MPIQRRLANAEFVGHAGEGDRVEPFSVCNF